MYLDTQLSDFNWEILLNTAQSFVFEYTALLFFKVDASFSVGNITLSWIDNEGNILDFVIFWYGHFFLWGDKNNTAIFFLRSGQCFDSFFVNKCWIKIPQASDLSCTVNISEKKLCIHSIFHRIKTNNCLIIFSNHGTMIELCRQTGCTFNSVNLFKFMNQEDRFVYKLK